jgi:chromosome segregation ATPase
MADKVVQAERKIREITGKLALLDAAYKASSADVDITLLALEKSKKGVERSMRTREKLESEVNQLKIVVSERGAQLGPQKDRIVELKKQLDEVRRLLGIHAAEYAAKSSELARWTKEAEGKMKLADEAKAQAAQLERERDRMLIDLRAEERLSVRCAKDLERLRTVLSRMDASIFEASLLRDRKTGAFRTWETRAIEQLAALESQATQARMQLATCDRGHQDARHALAQTSIARGLWKERISACEALIKGIDPETGKSEVVVLQKEVQDLRGKLDRTLEARERLLLELKRAMDGSAAMQAAVKVGGAAKSLAKQIGEIKTALRGHEAEWKKLEAGGLDDEISCRVALTDI